MTYRLPNDTQRTTILGKNGTGKSRAAVWHLAHKDFDSMPWLVLNHKREALINSIPGAQFVGLDWQPSEATPGLYIVQPTPGLDDDVVTDLLWRVYETENVGLYIDEGYMLNPRDNAMNAIYTQGRSKHIPAITLSQRPSRISRFAISEADFFQVFYLADRRDRKTLEEFIPLDFESLMGARAGEARALPDFHSIYYDVGRNDIFTMGPVPDENEIMEVFRAKLIPPEPDPLELPRKFKLL